MIEENIRKTYYVISFRVRSYQHTPEDVASAFEFKPYFVRRAHTVVGAKFDGSPVTNSYHYFYFRDFFGEDSKNIYLGKRVEKIIDKLKNHKELLATIRKDGGTLELMIGWFITNNAMVDFAPDLLERMGKLGVTLMFDVYGPDIEDFEK